MRVEWSWPLNSSTRLSTYVHGWTSDTRYNEDTTWILSRHSSLSLNGWCWDNHESDCQRLFQNKNILYDSQAASGWWPLICISRVLRAVWEFLCGCHLLFFPFTFYLCRNVVTLSNKEMFYFVSLDVSVSQSLQIIKTHY